MDISEVIEELAKKHNVTNKQVFNIIESNCSFIRAMIASGENKSIMIPHLGKIAIKPNRKLMLNKKVEIIRNNKTNKINGQSTDSTTKTKEEETTENNRGLV